MHILNTLSCKAFGIYALYTLFQDIVINAESAFITPAVIVMIAIM